jgi:hypothetical protein
MISDKFGYSSLDRVDTYEGRRYVDPTGAKLPSVTTILDRTKSEESRQALAAWRDRVGHAKAAEITKESSGRGTRMHKFLEDFVKSNVMNEPGSNPYSIQSQKMAKIIATEGLSKCQEFWGTEVSLYFPKLYAGTTDCTGVWNNKPAIIDFKQTNRPKKVEWIGDYFLQLVFYGTAHNEIFGTNISTGVIMMCSADYQYQEFVVDGSDWDYWEGRMWERLEHFYSL